MKTVAYYEYTNMGVQIGLLLTMRADGINPSSATYEYKPGKIVYLVHFFPNSSIIQRIENMNEDGNLDGPQITRTLNENGTGYIEDITIYENGEIKTINGIKQLAFGTTFNKNGLLDGSFKFQNSLGEIFEGKANNGEISHIKKYVYNEQVGIVMIVELRIDSMNIYKKEKERNSDPDKSETIYPLNNKIKLTNSSNLSNNNRAYYFLNTDKFSIDNYFSKIQEYYLTTLKTNFTFKDSLLNGNFQFRILSSKNDFEYADYTGEAIEGYFIKISESDFNFDSQTGKSEINQVKEYVFNKDSLEFQFKLTNSAMLFNRNENLYYYLNSSSFDFNDYLNKVNDKKKIARENLANEKKFEGIKIKAATDSLTNKKNELILLVTEQKRKINFKTKKLYKN